MEGWGEWSGIGIANSESGKTQAETTFRSKHVECHKVVCFRGKEQWYCELVQKVLG